MDRRGICRLVEFRELNTPLLVCKERVIKQAREMSSIEPNDPFWKQYTDVRSKILEMEAA